MLNNRLRDAHRIEVSFPEAHIADSAEPVPAPRAGFFGIAAPGHLAGIAMGLFNLEVGVSATRQSAG